MAVHTLASMVWTDVRALAGPRTVAIMPVGAIEAHGPHLPLGTDVIIAEAMARSAAERLSANGFEVVVLPPLAFAPAPFASSFAGTLNTPADATTMLVAAAARSLHMHGVAAMVIANAHHDPAHVAALRVVVDEVADTASSCRVVFPDLTRRRWAERLTAEFQSGACHAGRYEGSVVLAERPDLVRAEIMGTLPSNPKSLVDAIRRGDRTFADAGGPDAYFGFPAEATAAEGRKIIEILGEIVAEAVVDELGK